MTRQIPRTFIIPVETLNRELDGKLLLALYALQRGWKPIIGGRTIINSQFPDLPQSVMLGKGIRVGNQPRLLDGRATGPHHRGAR